MEQGLVGSCFVGCHEEIPGNHPHFPLVNWLCFLWEDKTLVSLKAEAKSYYLCVPEPSTASGKRWAPSQHLLN